MRLLLLLFLLLVLVFVMRRRETFAQSELFDPYHAKREAVLDAILENKEAVQKTLKENAFRYRDPSVLALILAQDPAVEGLVAFCSHRAPDILNMSLTDEGLSRDYAKKLKKASQFYFMESGMVRSRYVSALQLADALCNYSCFARDLS
jgi:hypothetical protein